MSFTNVTPYFAHSQARTFEQSYRDQATFIITRSLHVLAEHHRALRADTTPFILSGVRGHRVAQFERALARSPHAASFCKSDLRACIALWQDAFPAAEWQEISAFSTGDLDREAHALIREVRTLTGVARADSPALTAHAIAQAKVDGALPPILAVPSDFVERVCELSSVLCANLARDTLQIVSPHFTPMATTAGNPGARHGQIEALSLNAVEDFFPTHEDPVQDSALVHRLQAFIASPNATWKAMPAVERVQLMSAATHNHGFELYLHAIALEWIDSDVEATRFAWQTLSALNLLYELHEHEQLTGLDQFAQPYHFWGGAAVSCALIKRGHTPAIAGAISAQLGAIYEALTLQSRERKEPFREAVRDSELQMNGALWGAKACKFESEEGN